MSSVMFPSGTEAVLREKCPSGTSGSQRYLAGVHPPPPPPAQEGRQGPHQLRGFHLASFPRPAHAAGPSEGGNDSEGSRSEGGAGASENGRRTGGRLPAPESCCHTGPDSQILQFVNFPFQGVIPSTPPKQEEDRKREDEARMETSDVAQQQHQQQQKKQNSPSSSPEAAEAGFVMVPPSLAGDSSKHKTNQVTPLE